MNTCTIEIKGKEYVLCLTREAVKEIENRGFNIQNFVERPINMMDILWYGGFIANHKDVNFNLAMKLRDSYVEPDENGEVADIQEVIEFLADEYSNFVNAPADTKKKAKIVKA